MKPLERRMANNFSFQIGSALDRAKEWSFEEEKVLASSNERKVPSKHLLVFKMEKRRGKPVYLVGPFFLEKEQMNLVCSTVKKRLGSGGTCKEDWMEFQGDCKEKLKIFLQEEGFRFKG
ncbi:MAG: translation initiation factor [Campylobacteraceae bacterium]|nr:translation initiation factor [Campylobacteraceae bacterium]